MVELGAILPLLIALVAAPLIVVAVVAVRRSINGRRTRAWASAHGFGYRARATGSGRTPWQGMPFPAFGKYTVRRMLFTDTFTTGLYSAKPDLQGGGSIGRAFAFVEFELPTKVPHIMVTNRRASVLARTGLSVSGGKKLGGSTEFDGIFTLHCPADYERDALYIFTPDLLAMLIDYAPTCELELVDSTAFLYISRQPQVWRPGVGDALIEFTTLLRSKLERQTHRYRDERHEPEDAAASSLGVALGGLRLSQGMSRGMKVMLVWSWVPFLLALGWFVAQQVGLFK